MTIDIERAVLCSVLEADFLNSDKRIKDIELRGGMFTDKFHKLMVNAINRLKELKEPINTDFLRLRFMQANKWQLDYDAKLIEIIAHQPIATYDLFNSYYQQLRKNEAKYISI
ncbi:MAG: hypothetical protein OQL19_18425 [Gammaproteobacteria bacterium]|nr:hypothetical protein [Gammaproteobacteria bacterium]